MKVQTLLVAVIALLVFCACSPAETFTSTETPEPQYSDTDIVLGLDGTEAPYTGPPEYTALKGRGFVSDEELIVALNVPDTRIRYTFAQDLASAAQLCTEQQGLGFSPLDFASLLGGAVVLLAKDFQDTPPIGWTPLSAVPFHDNTVFYMRR